MEDSLVTAKAIVDTFGIPRSSLYRLAKDGKIRYHLGPEKAWRQRRELLFNPEEVAADIEALKQAKRD